MPWCASNFGLRPRRMDTVASTSGSGMTTFWNRRSSALSDSTCCLYSASVVAPTHRSSPRASAGFSRLDASSAPPDAPVPTTVWTSSMNRITFPAAAATSSTTALSRSSNSPRYLAPAMSRPMSSEMIVRPLSASGTAPLTMRCARPSAMAVLPTPGSPTRHALFLVRRLRIWIVRLISSSRPITGSSLPALASFVRSRPYWSSASVVASGVRESTALSPRSLSTAVRSVAADAQPAASKSGPHAAGAWSARPSTSFEQYWSPSVAVVSSACCTTACARGPKPGLLEPETVGKVRALSSTSCFSVLSSAGGSQSRSARLSSPLPSWRRIAPSRSSGSTTPPRRSAAACDAPWSASQARSVKRSGPSSFDDMRRAASRRARGARTRGVWNAAADAASAAKRTAEVMAERRVGGGSAVALRL
mmetsp:Transcript_4404/g.13971  ORF Transcript_4404/g.13971 Transcript_4404/m.13971 type:complete len:420 (-) Transcript_4404:346-1605(-)